MRLNLSVGALSCRRPAYLERAVTSLRAHIERDERDASVSWFCLDNTSSGKDREEIKGLNWDLLVLSKHNVGVGPGLNSLLSLVRSGYVLLLPDDWELGNAAGTQFLRESAIILQTDPRLAQVRLDAAPPRDFADKLRCDGPFIASGGKVNFLSSTQCAMGSFTFTPSLCRTEAFQDVVPFRRQSIAPEVGGGELTPALGRKTTCERRRPSRPWSPSARYEWRTNTERAEPFGSARPFLPLLLFLSASARGGGRRSCFLPEQPLPGRLDPS